MTLPKRRQTKVEAELAEEVYNYYVSSRTARQNTCYWDTTATGEISDTAGSGGGDWSPRWDLQEKMAIMHFEKPSRDEYESNVKSPMTAGRIDSTVQKLRKVNVGFTIRPQDSDDDADVRKARVVQELVNNLFTKGKFKHRLVTWFRDTLVHGVGFMQVYYLKKYRTVQIQVDGNEELTKDEIKTLKDGGRVYREQEVIEYDDIALEPVKIQEIYPDPSARYLHGESYEAQWIIRRMLPSFDQFEAMYQNDPDAKNVKNVRPMGVYRDAEVEFFEPPKDVDEDDVVELLHYYSKKDDRYVVVANDVVIKDMPLPYNHKQLPIVMATAIEHPHQLYGIGLPDRLLAIQTEEEILKNTVYDNLHIKTNPITKVKRNVYGEVSKAYAVAKPGMMVPVNNQEDIMAMEFPPITMDTFQAIQNLERDAVLASQIDPIQMGVMQKYVSATTSMLTKEQMDSFINSLVDSFSEPLAVAGYQIISLMRQFYTAQRVDDDLGEPKNRVVRLDGLEINPQTFEISTKKQSEFSMLEVKQDYFEISGDWDVFVSPESMEVISRAIEMQKSQANLAQLAPFMVDPSDTQSMMSHPAPYVNGPKLLEWYAETNAIPMDILTKSQEDDDIAMERAEEQGKRMLKGEDVPGIPGESEAHKRVHVKQLNAQNNKVDELKGQIDQLGPMAASYAGLLPISDELNEAQLVAMKIATHLQSDDSPAALIEEQAVQETMGQMQVPMPPGLNAAGGNQPPIPAGGNQGSGMMGEPQMGGPGGNSGRPPMSAQGQQ